MLDVEWDVGLTRSDDLMSRDLDSNLDDRLGSQISRHHRRTDRAHRGSPLEPTHLYFVSFTRQLKSRAQPQATVDQARRPPYSSLVGCVVARAAGRLESSRVPSLSVELRPLHSRLWHILPCVTARSDGYQLLRLYRHAAPTPRQSARAPGRRSGGQSPKFGPAWCAWQRDRLHQISEKPRF